MPITHTQRKSFFRNIFALVTVLVLLFTYNNCGERGFDTKSSASVEKMGTNLAAKYAGNIAAEMCSKSENYKCIHRIFSQDVESYEIELDYPCTNINGLNLCVRGKQFGFDTGPAILECGNNCETNYEYEEVSCYLDLKDDDNQYPISGENESFEDALTGAVLNCQKFVNGLSESIM